MRHLRLTAIVLTVTTVVAGGSGRSALSAQSPAAGYVALGDSLEFGVGDNVPLDGIGYVDPFGTFLSVVLMQPVQVHNVSVPGATTQDIFLTQLRPAIVAAGAHDPVVVSWGGGGNDLGRVVLTEQNNACAQTQSCLGRFNGLLNQVESAIDRTVGALRQAVGPEATILMRTQYNGIARTGCAPPAVVALGNAVLEGVPGTVLDQGLNDRIRAIAARYDARVVELFIPFAINPNAFVSTDCIHPNGAGYHLIESLFEAAFVAP
jgi:lysophospholipase L1-like esterase